MGRKKEIKPGDLVLFSRKVRGWPKSCIGICLEPNTETTELNHRISILKAFGKWRFLPEAGEERIFGKKWLKKL